MKRYTKTCAHVVDFVCGSVVILACIAVTGAILLGGCARVEFTGGSTHRLEGEARVVLAVDFSVCDDLPTEDKVECIKALLEILKEANKKDEPTFPGIGW